mmetsp:Transcript_1675/g.1507  ORF Transcript_1675/g.1507 Transcript_1675/m.1507 type:complete len:101 (+) Transcript_1675:436-738(+)
MAKTSSCNLDKLEIYIDELSPNVTLLDKVPEEKNCSRNAEVIYTAINEDAFSCNSISFNDTKSVIGIEIKDSETKESMADEFALDLSMPMGLECYESCEE